MTSTSGLNQFEREKYLSLETFRKNGIGVRTPVWFAAVAPEKTLYVYCSADSGKIKRLRRNDAVRVAPCDVRGKITGPWIDARARILPADAGDRAMALLNRKYWPWKQVLDFLRKLRPARGRAVIAIQLP